ncbi:MAG: serine protease [Saccharothrix sp.]|nr:serine protease [Saccharothrix sp.]
MRRARLVGLVVGVVFAQLAVPPAAQASSPGVLCLSASVEVGFDRALLPGANQVTTSLRGSVSHCSLPGLITGQVVFSDAVTSGCAQTTTEGTVLLGLTGLTTGLVPIAFTLSANTGKGPVLLSGGVADGPLAGYSVTAASPTAPYGGEPCLGEGITGYTLTTDLILTPPGASSRARPVGTSGATTYRPAIVGGGQADITDYPYTASVRIYDQHVCGGVILSPTIVLTAAHCVYGMDHSEYSVRVGNTAHSYGASSVVSAIRMHSGYNPDTVDKDIAVLELLNPLSFSSRVQPIEPASQSTPHGSVAWADGWGATAEGGQASSLLRAVDVDVISRSDCTASYGAGITSAMVCAGSYGHDTCQGDSGGPLAVNGRLVGLVSWGYGCARPEYPGVYTDVAALHDWIVDNTARTT